MPQIFANDGRFYDLGKSKMPKENDKSAFDDIVRLLHSEVAAVGAQLEWDDVVRRQYNVQAERYVQDLRTRVTRGQLTWRAAAEDARNTRDAIMQSMRRTTTPVLRALAEQKKPTSPTLNELVAKYTIEKFGPNANFNKLTKAERNVVYAEVVAASARPSTKVNAYLRRASRLGRGLIVVSVAVSAYNVATADDKTAAAGYEAASAGAGLAGSVAGGAVAGLFCGPGAPVCVTIGAFVGGAVFVLGLERVW